MPEPEGVSYRENHIKNLVRDTLIPATVKKGIITLLWILNCICLHALTNFMNNSVEIFTASSNRNLLLSPYSSNHGVTSKTKTKAFSIDTASATKAWNEVERASCYGTVRGTQIETVCLQSVDWSRWSKVPSPLIFVCDGFIFVIFAHRYYSPRKGKMYYSCHNTNLGLWQ